MITEPTIGDDADPDIGREDLRQTDQQAIFVQVALILQRALVYGMPEQGGGSTVPGDPIIAPTQSEKK